MSSSSIQLGTATSHRALSPRTILEAMSRTSRSRMGVPSSPGAADRSKATPPPRSKTPSVSPTPKRTEPAKRDRSRPPSPVPNGSVPEGIAFHFRVIRTYGPLAALVPMAITGILSALILWGSQSTIRGIIGFVLALMSCPTSVVFGFPVTTGGARWMAVIVSSAAIWAATGFVAARRSTSRAVAGWSEWRREWLRLAIGIWIGALVGLALAAILLTVDF